MTIEAEILLLCSDFDVSVNYAFFMQNIFGPHLGHCFFLSSCIGVTVLNVYFVDSNRDKCDYDCTAGSPNPLHCLL